MTSGWADFMGRVLQALTRRVEMGTAAKDWKHKRGRRFCGNESSPLEVIRELG